MAWVACGVEEEHGSGAEEDWCVGEERHEGSLHLSHPPLCSNPSSSHHLPPPPPFLLRFCLIEARTHPVMPTALTRPETHPLPLDPPTSSVVPSLSHIKPGQASISSACYLRFVSRSRDSCLCRCRALSVSNSSVASASSAISSTEDSSKQACRERGLRAGVPPRRREEGGGPGRPGREEGGGRR